VLELLQGEYLDRRENILLVGPSGTGKSHLATALGMAACAQGRKVRFFRVTELITLLLEAKEERVLLRLRQQLGKLDLLIWKYVAAGHRAYWRLPIGGNEPMEPEHERLFMLIGSIILVPVTMLLMAGYCIPA
jgi:energy-coupling factor transporter ATP-binding protein EcfA2